VTPSRHKETNLRLCNQPYLQHADEKKSPRGLLKKDPGHDVQEKEAEMEDGNLKRMQTQNSME